MKRLNIGEAVDILNILGCGDDPIFHRGQETTPVNLMYSVSPTGLGSAHSRIKFYTRRRKLVSGTLLSMLKERLEVK